MGNKWLGVATVAAIGVAAAAWVGADAAERIDRAGEHVVHAVEQAGLTEADHVLGLLDHHHDRRVDEDPDGQRNPPQRHDVRAETEVVHRNECGDDGDRECHDRHERRSHME